MNEFVRIKFPDENLWNLHSKGELYEILEENEIDFLDTHYNDLESQENYLTLIDGYLRENQEISKWRSILYKIANAEDKPMEILFFFDDIEENYGYRAYPNSTVKRLALEWNEMEEYVMILTILKNKSTSLLN